MYWRGISILQVAGLSLLFAWASIASAGVHPPDVNPDNFDHPLQITNTFFPLRVGQKFVYEGTKEGVPTHDEVCVTRNTKEIEGVLTRVVHHLSFEEINHSLTLVEDTFDWHAQDNDRNVWYFGEDTTDVLTGSKEGSWQAGVNDADAGFIMLADPQVGDEYYQEFAPKVAVDQAKVLSLDEHVCLNFRHESRVCYNNVLLTKETSQLDPSVVEYKYYAPGVGFIRGVTVKGPDERTELVSIEACDE